jgi:hypothetical protein
MGAGVTRPGILYPYMIASSASITSIVSIRASAVISAVAVDSFAVAVGSSSERPSHAQRFVRVGTRLFGAGIYPKISAVSLAAISGV